MNITLIHGNYTTTSIQGNRNKKSCTYVYLLPHCNNLHKKQYNNSLPIIYL